MTSCLWLERPGGWRVTVAGLVLAALAVPILPLTLQAMLTSEAGPLGKTFYRSLATNVCLGAGVASMAFAAGLCAGVLAAIYEFPGRRLWLAIVISPILIPSFLLALGWSS